MDFKAFIEIKETKASILDKLKFLQSTGLKEYLEYGVNLTGMKRLPKKSWGQVIEQIISKTPNDLDKKIKSREYYKAHLCAIKIVMEEMFLHDPFIKNIAKHEEEKTRDIVVYNYYHLLHELLYDMALLIQNYNLTIEDRPPTNIKLYKNPYQHDFTLYQTLPQSIFGQVSFHSFIEREPCISIALIRQIIELRIRKAFGILGVYDKVKDSFEPLPLGQIFDEIKKYQSEIDFAIPLENIIRLNGWANIFVHSGRKDYTWTLILVYRYLHEFIKGRASNNGSNTASGIKIRQSTLDNIRNGLESNLKSYNPNLEIHKTKPDVIILPE